MVDCRVACYLVFLNFYDAPLFVCLFSEYGDVNCVWRLIVINPAVHDFLRLLWNSGTISANTNGIRPYLTQHARLSSTWGQKGVALPYTLQS
jgi:hypothetical protein